MQFVWPSRFRILQLYIMGSTLFLKAPSLTFTENHKILLLGLLLGSVDRQTRVQIAYTLFSLYTVKLHYVKCSVPCSDFWSAYQHFHQEFTGCFNCVILYLATELGGICVFSHYPQNSVVFVYLHTTHKAILRYFSADSWWSLPKPL